MMDEFALYKGHSYAKVVADAQNVLWEGEAVENPSATTSSRWGDCVARCKW